MNNAKATVMIVDDTPGNLALLSDTLSEAGYRVLVATDGLSALEQMTYLKPDIILMDVMMPGIDGFETCKRLKLNPETADIPVLFMTALSELDDLLRGFGEGAVDYIVKPILPPEVLARVNAQLTQSRNLQRAQYALDNCSFSVLTISASGQITWKSPGASRWLDDLFQAQQLSGSHEVGELLPKLLLDGIKTLLAAKDSDKDAVESYQAGIGFSLKISSCLNAGEYLVVLEKHSSEWDLHSVKNSLNLTFREAEILMWISRGKTNKEVGMILGISPRTINKHLEHIFEKLGVATRAAAVSMVLQRI